jgi:hypothetical protein
VVWFRLVTNVVRRRAVYRAFGALLGLAFLACATPTPQDCGVADDFATALESGDHKAIAELFHYPPTYSMAQRADDAELVAESWAWLRTQFGAPATTLPHRSSATYYEIVVSGGDVAYWESISPFGGTICLYSTSFSDKRKGRPGRAYFRGPPRQSGSRPSSWRTPPGPSVGSCLRA